MKPLILFIVLFFSTKLMVQITYPTNYLSAEVGLYDRGLLGISYTRLKQIKSGIFIAVGSGAGVGAGLDIISLNEAYIGFNLNLNLKTEVWFGKGELKFAMGLQPKVVLRNRPVEYFKTSSVAGLAYLGMVFIDEKGFCMQARAGFGPYYDLNMLERQFNVPSVGFSFGKAI